MATTRQRLDQLLVDRGLAPTREKAQALILAGAVRVEGQRIDKPGKTVPLGSGVELLEKLRYVSRGGLKLEAALQAFQIDPTSWTCVDVGASTGGFTDCLLQHGAARVHAIDVGHGQLDWTLRNDARVVVHEGVNARNLKSGDLGEPCRLAVCDVSFISVTLILPKLPPLLEPDGAMVVLVKPQFEVGRREVGKGGIVREPELHEAACERVSLAAEALGYRTGLIPSPILGAEGNREFLLYASR